MCVQLSQITDDYAKSSTSDIAGRRFDAFDACLKMNPGVRTSSFKSKSFDKYFSDSLLQAVVIDPMEGIIPLLNRTAMQGALENAISSSKVIGYIGCNCDPKL